jgi:ribosomal protein S26
MIHNIKVGDIRYIRTAFGTNSFIGKVTKIYEKSGYCRIKGLCYINSNLYKLTNEHIKHGKELSVTFKDIGKIVPKEKAMAIAL